MPVDRLRDVLDALDSVTKNGDGYMALCPAHDDHRPSLSITEGDRGGLLMHCFAGCDHEAIWQALTARGVSRQTCVLKPVPRIVATYDYHSENGDLLFQSVRYEPKDFRQRQPDGKGGWIWSMKKVRRVLYRLPELMQADAASAVYVLEGEKDVDVAVAHFGMVATCNVGGAGKWRREYSEFLRGRRVRIIQDADEAGRKHGEKVAQMLAGIASSIKILEVPPPWKDLAEYVSAGGSVEELQKAIIDAKEWEPALRVKTPGETTLDKNSPLETAKEFASLASGRMARYAGSFYQFATNHYDELETDDVKASVYRFMGSAKSDDGEPFQPTRKIVADVMDALGAVCQIPPRSKPPCWLDAEPCDPDARKLVVCSNGTLDTGTMELTPPTPRLFCTHALGVHYDPIATRTPAWTKFLGELWGDDVESISTLQEWFGYIVAGDTRMHKIALLIGPKRSGKGTIVKALAGIVGEHNIAGPTLSSLQTNFGLSPLIGKPLAVISDARMAGRADQQAVVERLLNISGEDPITIDRKYRDPVTLRLPTRVMILSNELPKLADPSGALASRFLVLRFTRSWLGREDTKLFDRDIKPELSGILLWALAGWRRLQTRGRFIQPASADQAVADLEDLGSPISAFLRQCCTIDPAVNVARDRLYASWCEWCRSEGRDHAGTAASFGRDLQSAVPAITTSQYRVNGFRTRFYEGIGLGSAQVDTCANALSASREDSYGESDVESGESASRDNNGPTHVPTCASIHQNPDSSQIIEPMPPELAAFYEEQA